MNHESLPIELKNYQLAVNKRKNKRTIQGIKRIGKIALNFGVGFSGLVVSAIGGPITTAAGLTVAVASITNAEIEILYKKLSENSMFVQRKQANGEIKITQSIKDFKSFEKMDGFNPSEKLAMMGLELLVELQSIKQQFEDKGIITERTDNGENNVYPQIYTTKTHSGNIDTIEALEKLGYLQIKRKEPSGTSSLFFEKLGFRQYKEAREALFTKNQSKKVEMYELALQVTDKPIDFEEIYKSYTKLRGTREKSEKTSSIKRLGVILEALRNKNIDIVKNDIGETVIDYKAEESFAKRMKREQTDSNAEYRKQSYIGDKIQQGLIQSQELSSNDKVQETNQDQEIEI